ncbi:hypothetical protein Celaphus_00008569 [Cervus elaphus hippelaphus]|uniref:Uncharacterized protein n=1 Tax=Cervus elaphus hippelaphus TaxID=46360 RepID=A0A212CPC2_CEREH|nr:hypothetical protein Celaphus_00008569 [Cervus elaphus hippelaphus]
MAVRGYPLRRTAHKWLQQPSVSWSPLAQLEQRRKGLYLEFIFPAVLLRPDISVLPWEEEEVSQDGGWNWNIMDVRGEDKALDSVIALVLAFQSSGISGPILLPAAFREEGLSTHSSNTLPPAWAAESNPQLVDFYGLRLKPSLRNQQEVIQKFSQLLHWGAWAKDHVRAYGLENTYKNSPVVLPARHPKLPPSKACFQGNTGNKSPELGLSVLNHVIDIGHPYWFRKFKLIIVDVQGKNCLTNFHGMDLTCDIMCSIVKKWQTMIEAHINVKTTNGYLIHLFYAQHQQVRQIHKKMMEIITQEVQTSDLEKVVNKKGNVTLTL